ncbi:MAG: helix-turn-helix domain-containing protein [Bifidobacteriaceae bacterium]|jgi:excisionase family DNA binding protein|nr:helix-turn-helix domain-containing protein [Bifidobacteriaceae bacterium]
MEALVIPPESVRLNPSTKSDWAAAVLDFVSGAAGEGKTVLVTAEEKTFSPAEAAALAHVSRMTIRRRIDDGTIKATRRGSRWLIAASDLDRYRQQMWVETAGAVADDF